MSQSTTKWKKRSTTKLTCPSGEVVTLRRPSPSLTLKAARVARVLQKLIPQGDSPVDLNKQLEQMESLSDVELEKVMTFARPLVADVTENPPVSLTPDENQFSPDDLPQQDFWTIFLWAINGGPDMPVKLEEGETTIEAVQNFPVGQDAGDNASEDSPAM